MSLNIYNRWPELKEFLLELDQRNLRSTRDASEVILDDVDFCKYLNISKRKSAELRAQRKIRYSKTGGKFYCFLSDILEYVRKNAIPVIETSNRLSHGKP